MADGCYLGNKKSPQLTADFDKIFHGDALALCILMAVQKFKF